MKTNLQTNTRSSTRALGFALAFVLPLLALSSQAADYYAIVDNFGKRARNAFMDVSVDTTIGAGIDVFFSIYDAQGNPLFNDVAVRANSYGFVSSAWWANFFELTNGLPILVRARVPDGSPTSAANLHVDSLAAPMIVESFPTRRGDGAPLGMGTTFPIALGTFRSASLLIANVSGGDVAIDVIRELGAQSEMEFSAIRGLLATLFGR